MRHDLKKYYPTCEIERGHGGFVPDILCLRQRAPLFIEILVTHECSEENRTSGNRIIELVIDSEESIDKLVSSSVIRESENMRLYGFRRTEMSYRNLQRPLVKYTLYRSGKSHVSEESVNCRNYQNRHPSAIYEITASADADPVLMYLAGKTMAHREGLLQKDCSICFWLGGTLGARICKLYRKCGNPMWCEDNDAAKCRMFRENTELVEECLAICDSFGAYEIWRRQ